MSTLDNIHNKLQTFVTSSETWASSHPALAIFVSGFIVGLIFGIIL
jgi:hypothetical protein